MIACLPAGGRTLTNTCVRGMVGIFTILLVTSADLEMRWILLSLWVHFHPLAFIPQWNTVARRMVDLFRF